jgi:chloramphenicol 3-O phosphotransferase
MNTGKIIILNGTSSSGKSTLAKALQTLIEEPSLNAGIDPFIFMLPKRYLNPPLWYDVYEYSWPDNGTADGLVIKGGPLGRRLMMAMNHALAAMAHDGFTLVVDHVFIEREWLRDCIEALVGIDVLFVGVRCPLEVLEQRERERRDRTLGQARAQYDVVHAGMIYDVEVDTSISSPEECASMIMRHYTQGPPTAFSRLRDQFVAESIRK